MDIRPAVSADRPVIERLMAPEVARGTLLPRAVDPADFLVAEEQGEIVGAVALSAWTESVVELGALVAGPRGRGVGRALVAAALARAQADGFASVVALTGITGFFEAAGFSRMGATPWALARGCAALPISGRLDRALAHKAAVCAACPRLEGCAQALLCFDLQAAAQVAA